jgi:hypothetical protein
LAASLERIEDWACPNCAHTETTRGLAPNAQRYHTCGGLHGLNAPLVRAGVKAKVEALERPSYVGGELVTPAGDGRVYYAIQTTRDEGTDMVVLAPTARANLRGG